MTKATSLGCLLLIIFVVTVSAQEHTKLHRRDRKKDVALLTTEGLIILRLNDSTILHRDNFLRLVRSHYLDSTLFHRTIHDFVIQAGDPDSRRALPGQGLGNGGPTYTIPAEFHQSLFHIRGSLGMARDDNPAKASAASQFYIVQGKKYTDVQLDSLETKKARKFPPEQRTIYKTVGGLPKLDQLYTVFGSVVTGMSVVDRIAEVKTDSLDRPLQDVRIISVKLVRRQHNPPTDQ